MELPGRQSEHFIAGGEKKTPPRRKKCTEIWRSREPNQAPAHADGNTRPKHVLSAEALLLPPRGSPRAVTPPRRPCASAASPAPWPSPGRMPGSSYGTCSCGGQKRLIQRPDCGLLTLLLITAKTRLHIDHMGSDKPAGVVAHGPTRAVGHGCDGR